MSLSIVILAAGQGKRMQSSLPKVMHPIASKPMLEYVLNTSKSLAPSHVFIVCGHQKEPVQQYFANDASIHWIEQREQLGTGHAVLQVLPFLKKRERILILYGDVPLIHQETLQDLLNHTPENSMGMITVHLEKPFGYGRIIRSAQNEVIKIVEEKDATDEERLITEVNSGIYLVPSERLEQWLPSLEKKNAQGEYYLTDIITLAVNQQMTIHTIQPKTVEEIQGVNDKLQLAKLERFHQQQQAEALLRAGVTLLDPARIDVRGEVEVGQDVTIDVNVILLGKVKIGSGCKIGAHTILRDVILGDEVEIKSHSVIEEATIEKGAVVGPFARVRPGTHLAEKVHVGNFVEIKQSTVGTGTKINHLSYIGDSQIGKRVNVGAGTITCNYDGANKHKTIIEDDVQIGSDTQLVAPVIVRKGATIGAGSTIIKEAPEGQLTLTSRLEQRTVKNWQRPQQDEK